MLCQQTVHFFRTAQARFMSADVSKIKSSGFGDRPAAARPPSPAENPRQQRENHPGRRFFFDSFDSLSPVTRTVETVPFHAVDAQLAAISVSAASTMRRIRAARTDPPKPATTSRSRVVRHHQPRVGLKPVRRALNHLVGGRRAGNNTSTGRLIHF